MNIKIEYMDNIIKIESDCIMSIEIENKGLFYKFISDLYKISNYNYSDNIVFFEEGKELNMYNKLKIIVDYFDFSLNSKKYILDFQKYIKENIISDDISQLISNYNRVIKSYKKVLDKMELPIFVDEETNIDNIIKSIKISVQEQDSLLDNLLLLIDLEKVLNTNSVLIFVNLKQYLNKNELEELYKYSIYNCLHILLIDSQTYGTTLKNEKKIIIDEDLYEFMI